MSLCFLNSPHPVVQSWVHSTTISLCIQQQYCCYSFWSFFNFLVPTRFLFSKIHYRDHVLKLTIFHKVHACEPLLFSKIHEIHSFLSPYGVGKYFISFSIIGTVGCERSLFTKHHAPFNLQPYVILLIM